MTYAELLEQLKNLSPSQLNCDVTIEVPIDFGPNGFYPAELKICGEDHDVLDENHPVLLVS